MNDKVIAITAKAHNPDTSYARIVSSGERVELRVGRIQETLPGGPFDLVASALAVHHLDGPEKAELFKRIRSRLSADGRFVLADLVVPDVPVENPTPSTPGFDKPSTVAEQLDWLEQAGFDPSLAWTQGDLALIVATATRAGTVAAT